MVVLESDLGWQIILGGNTMRRISTSQLKSKLRRAENQLKRDVRNLERDLNRQIKKLNSR